MRAIAAAFFMLLGSGFMLIASIGIIRMPDVFTRMQASAKAGTLGASCMLLGVAIHFNDLGVTTRALAIILFAFLTAPVGAHMIARAAHFVGVEMWETRINELRGQYDPDTHELSGQTGRDIYSGT
jgi:multicomponent Na+:H+ antiporter subunit G